MNELLAGSLFFGGAITLVTYLFGTWIRAKLKKAWLNPILISVLLTVGALLLMRIDYDTYYEGAKYISYLLTPATVCLAVPLYEHIETLKKNWLAVTVGIITGVVVSLTSVLVLSLLFRFDHAQYVTFLPKSITTAIGMEVSRELGGYVSLTVAVIIITGILGNVAADGICKLFRIKDPVAKGIAIGSASHALGTARAMEMGEVEGAMSSLSIVTAGICTVLLSMVYGGFI